MVDMMMGQAADHLKYCSPILTTRSGQLNNEGSARCKGRLFFQIADCQNGEKIMTMLTLFDPILAPPEEFWCPLQVSGEPSAAKVITLNASRL
jgi:hypothetical protein